MIRHHMKPFLTTVKLISGLFFHKSELKLAPLILTFDFDNIFKLNCFKSLILNLTIVLCLVMNFVEFWCDLVLNVLGRNKSLISVFLQHQDVIDFIFEFKTMLWICLLFFLLNFKKLVNKVRLKFKNLAQIKIFIQKCSQIYVF